MNKQLERTSHTTKALNGKQYNYTYSTGMGVHLEITEDEVIWKITAGKNKGESGTNKYLAREIDQGIYLIQWYEEI